MRVLHAGCGGAPLPPLFGDCEEVRLDINKNANPDVVASLTDMGDIGTFDAAYCSHCLEHLYPHEVRKAASEFYRITAVGGYVVILVPDLEGVRATEEVLFVSPAGPISGLDLIYGYRPEIPVNPFMAHHSGFTAETLERVLTDAGFDMVTTKRICDFNLMAVAQRKT